MDTSAKAVHKEKWVIKPGRFHQFSFWEILIHFYEWKLFAAGVSIVGPAMSPQGADLNPPRKELMFVFNFRDSVVEMSVLRKGRLRRSP